MLTCHFRSPSSKVTSYFQSLPIQASAYSYWHEADLFNLYRADLQQIVNRVLDTFPSSRFGTGTPTHTHTHRHQKHINIPEQTHTYSNTHRAILLPILYAVSVARLFLGEYLSISSVVQSIVDCDIDPRDIYQADNLHCHRPAHSP